MHPDCSPAQWQQKPCQEWNHRGKTNQYALVHWRGTNQYVHRVAWALSHDVIVESLTSDDFICHHCDNPRCFEPLHLFASTNRGNQADANTKGRAYRGGPGIAALQGEHHPSSKLTDDQVLGIRAAYAAGAKQRAIGEQYGVTQTLVSMIVRRKIWTHI